MGEISMGKKVGSKKGIEKRPTTQRALDMDMVINEVVCDLTNGTTTADVLRKLQNGLYETPHYKDKNLSQKQSYNILKRALNETNAEVNQGREVLRNLTFQRYLSIYEDAVQNSDRANALRALESMSKLLGLNATVENQTNVQINSADGEIKINFGFNNDNQL